MGIGKPERYATNTKNEEKKMPLIDFKEIPQANITDGKQDTFELFARDFFELLGFKIATGPDRGQDGGRDLIVVEERTGILDNSSFRWLVSCKHKCHSGKSVVDADEIDIQDRLSAHNCSGFIGFYSTVISAPFGRKLDLLKQNRGIDVQVFDNEKIESILLLKSKGIDLIQRYFPKSFEKVDNKRPSNLFSTYTPLKCKVCGKDLLESESIHGDSGVIVMAYDRQTYYDNHVHKYMDIYWACKGNCDRSLERAANSNGLSTGWEDISDLVIPYNFLKWNIAILNRIRSCTDQYEDQAFEDLKEFIICISQIVYKNQSDKDIQRIMVLKMIPEGI